MAEERGLTTQSRRLQRRGAVAGFLPGRSRKAVGLVRNIALPLAPLVVALTLSACVADAPAVDASDSVLVEGRQLYINNCIGCHGSDGGGGTGSKLNDGTVVANYPDIADQIRLVAEGKNQMPAFAGKLSEAELEAVSRYTREGL